MKKGFTYMDSW